MLLCILKTNAQTYEDFNTDQLTNITVSSRTVYKLVWTTVVKISSAVIYCPADNLLFSLSRKGRQVVLHWGRGVCRVSQWQCHICSKSKLQSALRLASCHCLQNSSRSASENMCKRDAKKEIKIEHLADAYCKSPVNKHPQVVIWRSSTTRSLLLYSPSLSTRDLRLFTNLPECAPSVWASLKDGEQSTGESNSLRYLSLRPRCSQ